MPDERKNDPIDVAISETTVYVRLRNGQILTTPLAEHPWLANATPQQQSAYTLYPYSILWDELDDGLDIEWLRQNRPQPAS